MNRTARKNEHINHAMELRKESTSGFCDIQFVHQSLPDINIDDIDLTTTVGELELSSPIFINAMTGGGGERTTNINRELSLAAAKTGIGMAVGSQMAAIKDPTQRKTFEIVREVNPDGFVVANLGSEATVEQVKLAIDMLGANAIQIHLNVIQELVMPEGDRSFNGALKRIEDIVSKVDVPVIAKEVGFGISSETAKKLHSVGVEIIDVGGFGGTNFSEIENKRRENKLNFFNHWGLLTTASIVEVKQSLPSVDIISSGGLSNSLEVLKSLALGANLCGLAGYFLEVLFKDGSEGVVESIEGIHQDLRLMMTALGKKTIKEVQNAPIVITGETYHWLNQRNFNTKGYSIR